MELIRTLSQMVNCLRSRGIRRKVAVVCPNDPHTEYVIIRSLREEIAEYLLVTDSAHLKEALDLRAASPDFVRIYEAGTPDEAAALAVQLVRTGEAEVLMKGLINTDNLLRAVLKKGEGLLPEGGVLSHVAVAQVPLYHKLLFFFGCGSNSSSYFGTIPFNDRQRPGFVSYVGMRRTPGGTDTLHGENQREISPYPELRGTEKRSAGRPFRKSLYRRPDGCQDRLRQAQRGDKRTFLSSGRQCRYSDFP